MNNGANNGPENSSSDGKYLSDPQNVQTKDLAVVAVFVILVSGSGSE